MTLDELRAAYDREQRIDVDYPDTRRKVAPLNKAGLCFCRFGACPSCGKNRQNPPKMIHLE